MKLKITTVLFFSIYVLNAQIIPSGNWGALLDTSLSTITSDADNGDGLNDGAIQIRGLSTTVGQGATFTFNGSPASAGENIKIVTTVFNANISFVKYYIELYNITDNTLLTIIPSQITILGSDTIPVVSTLNYTTVGTDIGDTLQLRYRRSDDGNTARHFSIDILQLNNTLIPITATTLSSDSIEIISTISIFPNPASDVVKITDLENELVKIEVYNVNGQKVISKSNTKILKVDALKTGIYFVKIFTKKGVSTIKLIKE